MIVKPEDLPEFHRETLAAIRRRTAERIERTITSGEAFAASPAYERAIEEIVAKGRALLEKD